MRSPQDTTNDGGAKRELGHPIRPVVLVLTYLLLYGIIRQWYSGPLVQGSLVFLICILAYWWFRESQIRFASWVGLSIVLGVLVYAAAVVFG
jgi:hypothetical protein